ncbi:hypothetical protein Poly51_43170 [Rubripirellula tenax]|uniref:Arrestin-like N-terminal domain-containing protein n=1 Tax=Rubripirellula tenax TaxID=2528015 RepID=A0A5C6EMR7_9BACT|nr:sporulation protein [Rubripirellula tenax]TWU51023.1 hypothetical protein Poly51_43170 [Rubripirellula tenax]
MAKCDLSIELDDPSGVVGGGGKISGVVRVLATADVQCSGLEVNSVWKTHGRGNVATGTAGSSTLFEGKWQAGDQNEYRFELPVANWPPTYHGFHLNVDHYVEARAKVPWSFDPKASVAFVMQPTCGAEGLPEAKAAQVNKIVAWIITITVLSVFAGVGFAVLRNFGVFGYVFMLVPVAGVVYWLVRKVLPQWVLGAVECSLASDVVAPGDAVTGELVVEPRKNVSIGAVSINLTAAERCVSGSGSNQTTHRHTVFDESISLGDATTFRAGQTYRFPISFSLPADAAYTISLTNNELMWTADARIDIPRWPDWTKSMRIRVVPTGKPIERASESSGPTNVIPPEPEPSGGEITFAETARHVFAVRDDRSQVEMLVEAVTGMAFDIEAEIERRLLYAGDEDPHVYKNGFAVWAKVPDPPLPLVLYVPHDLGDEFEQAGRGLWRGKGSIVGWDSLHGRLQIKL